jgi:predicted transcriptional regulator
LGDSGVFLNRECEKAMRLTIPAVRIAVSCTLKREHGMSETLIARRLGIAQAAVSKYISGDYSKKVARVVEAVVSQKVHLPIVNAILKDGKMGRVPSLVDKVASGSELVAFALG